MEHETGNIYTLSSIDREIYRLLNTAPLPVLGGQGEGVIIAVGWKWTRQPDLDNFFGRSFLLPAVSRSDVIVVISGWLFSGTK